MKEFWFVAPTEELAAAHFSIAQMFTLRDNLVVSLGYLPAKGVSDIIVDDGHLILVSCQGVTELYTLDISGDNHIYQ